MSRHAHVTGVAPAARRRAVLAVLAVVAGAAVAVSGAAVRAAAAASGTATTPAGQQLSVTIDSPTDASTLTSAQQTVSGTAALDAAPPAPGTGTAMLLADLSGSTTSPDAQDCNADGQVSGAQNSVGGDNLNGDGRDLNFGGTGIGDMLDCEIAGMRSLAANLPPAWRVTIGGFAGSAAQGNPFNLLADDTTDITAQTTGLARQQMDGTTLGAGTNLAAALTLAAQFFHSAPVGDRQLSLLTDGAGDDTSNSSTLQSAVSTLQSENVVLYAYVVNPAGSCDTNLLIAANQTGGSCRGLAHVTDAAALAGPAGRVAATLGAVSVSLDGVTVGTSAVDAAGGWSVPVTVPSGTHTLRATVSTSDSTSATASVSVTGVPSTSATSTGQFLSVDITSPATGTHTATPPTAVTGTVALSSFAPRPQTFGYVVDVSGSTSSPNRMDCNGDKSVTAADDVNGDRSVGDTLDCELAGVEALDANLPSGRDINVGVEALGDTGAFAQMTSTAGTTAIPYTDTTDLNYVLSHTTIGLLNAYKQTSVGQGTDYDDALVKLGNYMSAQSGRAHVAYFLSDGQPDEGDLQFRNGLASVLASHTVVNTFGVGAASGTCAATAPLAVLAARTGGTCTVVTNPANLVAALTQPVSISGVTVSVDSGPGVAATVNSDGTWSAPVTLAPGNHLVTATATASDGTRATESSTVDVYAAPQVSFAQDTVHVAQGSSIQLAPTVTDADTPAADLTYAWSPAAGLDDPTAAAPTAQAGDVGSRDYTLTVTDPQGNTGHADVTVVTDDVAPTITALDAPTQAATGTAVTTTVSFTDPGTSDSHTVTIDWGDGTTSTPTVTEPSGATPGSATASHTYTAGGQGVTLSATVTDNHGLSDLQDRALFVDTTPTVSAGGPTYTVPEGSSVQLEGSATDPDAGDSLTVAWTPGAGLTGASTTTPTFHAVDDGSTPLTITATDSHGVSAADTTDVVVTNVAPSVDSLTVPTGVQLPGAQVSAAAAFTDPGVLDTHIASVDWGDGSTSTGSVTESGGNGSVAASHRYSASGTFTVTLTVTDKDGGVGTRNAQVTVDSPPNVTLRSTYDVNEGSTVTLAPSASDPDGDALTYRWTPADAVQLSDPAVAAPTFAGIDDSTQTLTVTVTDPYGLSAQATTTVTVHDVAPTVTSFTGPVAPTAIGTAVTLNGSFTDPGILDTHTATIAWGDGTSSPATVTESGGTFTASHAYTSPIVANPVVTVTDNNGKSGTATLATAVVAYDPNGSFITGGGYLVSASGTKNNLAFNARYPKGSTTPTGSVEYHDNGANLVLKSVSEDWLVTNRPQAQLQGSGTVNGTPGYRFQLTVLDGQATGGGGVDRARVHIWAPDGSTYYDTQPGAPDSASPTTAMTGGSITIH